MTLQTFIARTIPTISAVWLNAVDRWTTVQGTASGTANAVIVTLDGVLTGLTFNLASGNKVSFTPITPNTGATTLNIGSTGIQSLVNQFGNPCTGGELSVPVTVQWNGAAWQIIGGSIPPDYARTAAETAAGVTPSSYIYKPGDVRRYGAILNGVADDTAALGRWASVPGLHTFPVNANARITDVVPMVSNSNYEFARGSRIQQNTADRSIFTASGLTNVHIKGGTIQCVTGGNAANVSGVFLLNSNDCSVRECEFIGMQWAAVNLDGCLRCDVSNNYCHNPQHTTVGDRFGIVLYRSHYCIMDSNRIIGGHGGILVQDPLASGVNVPTFNKVRHNIVTDVAVYGIVIYLGGTAPTFNEATDNEVSNVDGTPAIQLATGTGIYCVGSGLGATKVSGNNVRNCCISTTTTTNGPAGITVADVAVTAVMPTVVDNTVSEMAQGDGILIVTSPGGAIVSSNSVIIPASNNGTGPGGATLLGVGIRNFNSDNTIINANNVRHLGSSDAILSVNSATGSAAIVISNNRARAATGNAIRVDRTVAQTHTDLSIVGNTCRSDAAASLITIAGGDRVAIAGNSGASNTGACIAVSASLSTILSGNSMNTNGTNGFTMSGTCTGSYFDKTNRVNGNIANTSVGGVYERFGDAVPAAGSAIIGDRIEKLTATVGQPKGWRCTGGGSPGTFTSEGNL